MSQLSFAKGHGTENDFVLLPDLDARLTVTEQLTRALCGRRSGIGGDGLIRVVPTASVPEVADQAAEAEWFMDYRNADGSIAEMCGNGVRVFVGYLQHLGLVRLADGDRLAVATRAGVKQVRREGELLAVDLGPWSLPGGAAAVAAGQDVTVMLPGEPVPLPGLRVELGNPHTVVMVPGRAELAAVDLTRAPELQPAPPRGANVEVVVPLHDATAARGHLLMRVHERGVGETRSCGTGAAAAVLAARAWAGPLAPRHWTVDVPGGRLEVAVPAGEPGDGPDGAELRGPGVVLAGPARIVATGTLDPRLLDGAPPPSEFSPEVPATPAAPGTPSHSLPG